MTGGSRKPAAHRPRAASPRTPTAGATTARDLLRFALAVVAYRGLKPLRDAPESYPDFRAAPLTRTPREIVAHIGDLYAWAVTMAKGDVKWVSEPPREWDVEVDRLFRNLKALDRFLASRARLGTTAEKLMAGPVADSLQHIGQLTMLRRLAGAPIRGENYARADIATGRVGKAQRAPKSEFD